MFKFSCVLVVALVACKSKGADKTSSGSAAAIPPAPPAVETKEEKAAAADNNPADDQPPPPPPEAKPCPDFVKPTKGTLKVTATGAKSSKLEFGLSDASSGTPLDGGGVSLGFRTESGNEKIAIQIPCGTGKVTHSLSNAQAFGGIYIVGECTIDVTKNDKTGIAGTFECPEQKPLNGDAKDALKLTASFSLTP